jgi:acyl-[acyl carrier protein]--UDP-N-acetylglucosamine O-acyltransferase
MKIEGNLIITRENAPQYAALTTVGGYLSIRDDAQLPALTSVGGYLHIGADAQLPALTSVGGKPYTQARATARATSPRRPA